MQETAQSYDQNSPGTITLENASTIWQSALRMQYHMNTADRKYQQLFVVNFVKLYLTAVKLRKFQNKTFREFETDFLQKKNY